MDGRVVDSNEDGFGLRLGLGNGIGYGRSLRFGDRSLMVAVRLGSRVGFEFVDADSEAADEFGLLFRAAFESGDAGGLAERLDDGPDEGYRDRENEKYAKDFHVCGF